MSQDNIRILAIEDDESDAELLRRALEDIPGLTFEFSQCASVADATRQLNAGNIDLVFLDYLLGADTGVDLLRTIRVSGYLGPVIAMSGQGDERIAAEIMRSGADDYLVKVNLRPTILQRSIAHAEAQHRRRRAEKELSEKNQLLAKLLEKEKQASRLLEDAIQRTEEANRAKSEFLAKMSHELRTPLNSIIGFTEIMMQDTKDPPNEKRAMRLEKVHRNSRILLALINDILDLSKIEAGQLTLDRETVTIAPLLNECVESAKPLLRDRPVELRCQIEPEVLVGLLWTGDPLRLRQIVTNLLSNAAKFTESGHIEVRARTRSGKLQIEVEDTGIGIAEKHQARIFEEFEQVDASSTRRAGGTGLGLAICKKLTECMGGQIAVRSTLNSGSCFIITLPLGTVANVLKDEKNSSTLQPVNL